MTPEEYKERLEALEKQEIQLAQEFINDNPFKELEGKLVNLTTGFIQRKVLFVGAGFTKNIFGKPDKPALFYHKLNKDGNPRKNSENILLRYYDGKTYRFDKICRK